MQTAVHPDFFNNLPTIINNKKLEGKQLSDEEKELFAMSQQPGWRILAEYINDLLKDLDKGTATAMAQGLPFEEIGRNAVVIDLAKGIIKNILDKVQDANDAVERERK